MSIPTMLLIEEIKQEGFSDTFYRNIFGELCIGYGHRIMENPELLNKDYKSLANRIRKINSSLSKENQLKISRKNMKRHEVLFEMGKENKMKIKNIYKNKESVFYEDGKKIEFSKNFYEKELEALENEILECSFTLELEKAENLLKRDILISFENLSRNYLGFRRLQNLCSAQKNTGFFLKKSFLAKHYSHLKKENQESFRLPQGFVKKRKLRHQENFNNSKRVRKDVFEKMYSQNYQDSNQVLGKSFKVNKKKNENLLAIAEKPENKKLAKEKLELHKNYNENYYTTSAEYNDFFRKLKELELQNSEYDETSLENNDKEEIHSFDKKTRKKKKKKTGLDEEIIQNWMSAKDRKQDQSALIRLDTIIYLAHIIGPERIKKIQKTFDCLKEDDYHSAAGFLLSNAFTKTLGAKAVILSRRLRYGLLIKSTLGEIPEELMQDVHLVLEDKIKQEKKEALEDWLDDLN